VQRVFRRKAALSGRAVIADSGVHSRTRKIARWNPDDLMLAAVPLVQLFARQRKLH
jgi:hypothetical protein